MYDRKAIIEILQKAKDIENDAGNHFLSQRNKSKAALHWGKSSGIEYAIDILSDAFYRRKQKEWFASNKGIY